MRLLKDIKVGDTASLTVEVSPELVRDFAEYSGDRNPLHLDPAFAERTRFKRPVAHGLSYASLFSTLVGTKLPGPGALWTSQTFKFAKPVSIGDTLELKVTVSAKSMAARSMTLQCAAVNQNGELVLSGEGEVSLLEVEADAEGAAEQRGRRTLVVGGSRGIGAAVVSRLAGDGHEVAFTYMRSRAEADRLCDTLENVSAIAADARRADDVPRLLEQVFAKLGDLPDTVVFCASERSTVSAALSAPYERFERHIASAIAYPHAVLSLVAPTMIKNKFGCIVAVGSTHAISVPPPGHAPYVSAKAALTGFIRSVAVEYGHHGIRANVVAPSMTETAFLTDMPDHERKVASMKNPRRRLATPRDVAGAVAYLVSDDAEFVTGETLIVSGGSVIR